VLALRLHVVAQALRDVAAALLEVLKVTYSIVVSCSAELTHRGMMLLPWWMVGDSFIWFEIS
jgi:hypothetical protein